MEGGLTAEDHMLGIKVCLLHASYTHYMWIVAHNMNTYSLDYTTQNKRPQNFG